jgi:ABC-2 type transport system ATP-binding protein
MREGRLVAQGTVGQVRSAGAAAVVEVTTTQPELAAQTLRALGLTGVVTTGTGASAPPGDLPPEQIVAALVAAGVGVRGFAVTAPSLEDLFVSLTGEGFDVSG